MKLFKKLIIATLAVPTVTFAGIFGGDTSKEQIVWLPFTNGPIEVMCRAIWTEYDERHGTNSIIIPKPGNDGIISLIEMSDSKANANRKIMCGGSSQFVFLPVTNKAALPEINKFELLARTVNNVQVYYVNNSNPAKNFKETMAYFKSLNRPINIAYYFATQRATINYIEKTYNLQVNAVPFKTTPQIYPSLIDNSIDLAIDSGASIPIAQSGKFRVIGYVATHNYEQLKAYNNFRADVPELIQVSSWLNIAVLKAMDPDTKKLLAQRVKEIINTDKFKKLANDNYATVNFVAQPEIGRITELQRAFVERNWKQ
jgi:tripartite-type tricarboxylate transporter receptor subunit TctC